MNRLILILVFFFSSTLAAEEAEARMNEGWQKSAREAVPFVLEQFGSKISEAYSFEYLLSANVVAAMLITESLGDKNAVSSANAIGLLQLRQIAVDDLRRVYPNKLFRRYDLRDPKDNIELGMMYVKMLRDYYGFETLEDWAVAYNMGPDAASKLTSTERFRHPYAEKVRFVSTLLPSRIK